MAKQIIQRQQRVKKRKGLVSNFIFALLGLALLVIMIFQLPPDTLYIVLFLTVFFFTLLFILKIFTANKQRMYTIAVVLVLFLILCVFGLGNFLNAILLLAIGITADVLYKQKK